MKEQLYQNISDLFSPKKYDPDWNVRQSRLSASKSRGRKDAPFVRYLNEAQGDNREPYNLDEESLLDRLKIFEAFLQPNQPFQVFIPQICLRGFFDQIMQGNIPENAYKGVSYNPNLVRDGEKLDNLDFFAWAKQVQETVPGFELTILDASPYEVLNRIDARFPRYLRDREFADWFYDQIDQGITRDPELEENCRLRNLYLRALLGVSGVRGDVVSALDLIRNRDPVLLSSLEEARSLCGVWASGNGQLNVDRFIPYRRYGKEFAKTYTPAVVAEALFFLRRNGIMAKLGPTSEMAFDNLIADAMQQRTPYNFFWYSRPFEKTGTRENRLYVQDSSDKIERKLAADDGYARWMNTILEPFSNEQDITDKAVDINERIRQLLL